jgi:hypothetical protein
VGVIRSPRPLGEGQGEGDKPDSGRRACLYPADGKGQGNIAGGGATATADNLHVKLLDPFRGQ